MYEGQFVGNQRHGHGRYISARGEEYEGAWAHDQRSGQGTSIALPADEAESQRQRVSAELLTHRKMHFLRLAGNGMGPGRV